MLLQFRKSAEKILLVERFVETKGCYIMFRDINNPEVFLFSETGGNTVELQVFQIFEWLQPLKRW